MSSECFIRAEKRTRCIFGQMGRTVVPKRVFGECLKISTIIIRLILLGGGGGGCTYRLLGGWIELAWWESQLVLAASSGTYMPYKGNLSWAFNQPEFNCIEEDPITDKSFGL